MNDYILLAVISMLAYSLQSTLMTLMYRSVDRLTAVAWRGISLIVTMAPALLIRLETSELSIIPFLPLLLGLSLLAALANWMIANAFACLSVGVASALALCSSAIVATVLGTIALHDSLNLAQYALIGLLLLCGIALSISRSPVKNAPSSSSPILGLLYCVGFGVLIGICHAGIGSISRQVDPLVTAYLWESLIGVIALLMVYLRAWRTKQSAPKLSIKQLALIAVYSSPTAIGTCAMALAMAQGPVGVVSAIISTMIVSNSLLAWLLFKERLSMRASMLILCSCALVVGLKIAS